VSGASARPVEGVRPRLGRVLCALPVVAVLALLAAGTARAAELAMVRSVQPFPETMLTLQQAIRAHGYVITRVQRVDVGLTRMGYKTDLYRVVFYGKPDEIRRLAQRYPDLIPYLPLKLSVFAEGGETLVVGVRPLALWSFFDHPELFDLFARWDRDLQSILDEVREAR